MFENVLHQPHPVAVLERHLRQGSLPQALLFHGPGYSGKMTTALELARGLTCEAGDAPWSCRCTACRQQRLLLHPNTLLLGHRYFLQEILASAEAVKREPKVATAYLFVRAVRKLLRRFDPVLWQAEENARSRLEKPLNTIAERLGDFSPDQGAPVPEDLNEACDEIVSAVRQVTGWLSSDNVPVHVVRALGYWAHLSSGGERKVAIIESADRMHEGSRNALLKLLEEPPPGVYLILVTTNKQGVIPTILSRVRPVSFAERDEEAIGEVLQRIFREHQVAYASLREYFVHCSFPEARELRGVAETFAEAAAQGSDQAGVVNYADSIFRTIGDREAYRYFCECLLDECRRRMREGGISLEVAEQWSTHLHDALIRHDTLNIAAPTALHALFERMKDAACASLSNER
jgi:DNA polymerase-3 subunit gamma/tau